jgi:hypothetical protein
MAITASVQTVGNTDTLIYTSAGANDTVNLGLLFGSFIGVFLVHVNGSVSDGFLTRELDKVQFSLTTGETIHAICPNGYGMMGLISRTQ